ncbi:unannotated protein [freshwater metagenome]|uniref:Unannotated protein n=1 Tax=freshwater metagenome TaxID=449393 RepID=A0A6J7GAF3_9ZZZZ
MAPAGPPSDPPDGHGPRRDRDADDWDWGDEWDAHEHPAGDGRTPRRDAAEDAPTPPDAPRRHADPDADAATDATAPAAPAAGRAPRGDDHAPDAAGASPRPVAGGSGPSDDARAPARRRRAAGPARPVLRRRSTAVVAALAALVLVVLGASALTGDDDAPAARDGGDELRRLTGLAARAADEQAGRAAALRRYARIGRPIYCGAGRKPWVALTFDDGPGPLSPRWITSMSKAGVPMTLFRIGRNVPGNEEYVRVQRNLGWDSGSHTQDHPALATLDAREQRRQIERGDAASRRVLGRPPVLFRPPYESHDRDTDRIVEDLGMVEVLWNVDTQDALGTTSADEIVATAERGMRPGSIILLHEVKPNTLEAMPRIVAALREKGLRPVTVSEMLAGDGPSEAQLRKGYGGCPVDLTPGTAAS